MELYIEKRTKIIIILVFVIVIIVTGLFTAFHTIFRYKPQKTELYISATRENFLDYEKISIDENKLIVATAQSGDNVSSGVTKTVLLSDDEVKSIFRFVVKKNRFFLLTRGYDNPDYIELTGSGEWDIREPPTNYIITVKFNDMERTIGGKIGIGYSKIMDFYHYMVSIAIEHFGESYNY